MTGLSIDFDRKVALIVGATGAIGAQTARLFAQANARLVHAGRDASKGTALLAEVEGTGAEAMFVACDVTETASMEHVVAAAVDRFGRTDCAFNNAGWEGAAVESAEITE